MASQNDNTDWSNFGNSYTPTLSNQKLDLNFNPLSGIFDKGIDYLTNTPWFFGEKDSKGLMGNTIFGDIGSGLNTGLDLLNAFNSYKAGGEYQNYLRTMQDTMQKNNKLALAQAQEGLSTRDARRQAITGKSIDYDAADKRAKAKLQEYGLA